MAEINEEGIPLPKEGVDENYDQVLTRVDAVKKKLVNELEYWKKKLNCHDIKFINNKNYKYQIEVPEKYVSDHSKRPKELILTSKAKGVLRF